jgi:glycosyltransferase involved in cell wall biosynthesis
MQLHKIGTVYVMPSPAELQSIATLEAMASGQPVVAVDAGALRELCQDGRNGYLCERDNITEITDGIKRILSDDELREKYSKESLAIASTHDLNTTLERFESLYSDIIKS